MKNEFKGNTVEEATQLGLESLGLTAEQVDITVIKESGVFSKAAVSITPKVVENNKSGGQNFLEGILSRMNLQVTVEEKIMEEEICYYISGENASGAIGHRGDTLDAIQYLVSQYINKDKEIERKRVTVDADFYREKRIRTLTSLAKRLARDASRTQKEIELEPMNSYERRIIHASLQENDEATTRSEGEGKDRHIVIVPKSSGDITYGSSDFKKTGPTKTRSFGYSKKKF